MTETVPPSVRIGQGLLLLDLADLRAIQGFVTEHAKALEPRYGRAARASVGAIQRRLLTRVRDGGEHLFGEPALALADLMRTAPDGRGIVAAISSTCWRPTARSRRRGSTPRSCCGYWRSCSRNCPKSAIPTNPSSSSSSTRRICCSAMRRRRSSTRSSRWCG